MKISQKELQKIISEEFKLSIEEGEIDEGWLDDLKAKAKSGWDVMSGKGRDVKDYEDDVAPDADETADEKEIEDKSADFNQELGQDAKEVNTELGQAGDAMLSLLKTADDAIYQLNTLSQNFVHDPADQQSQKVAAELEDYISDVVDTQMQFNKHLRKLKDLTHKINPGADVSRFTFDPTASAKTRAGTGLRRQTRAKGAAHMFEGNNGLNKTAKQVRKAVKEELYNLLVKKIK